MNAPARVLIRRPDRLALLGAAYAMTERAYVGIRLRRSAALVLLWPKGGARALSLEAALRRHYQNESFRWSLARRLRAGRLEELKRAALLAEVGVTSGEGEPPAPLSAARRREIEVLLAEVGPEQEDPLGISRPWAPGKR